jgi:hypothetical protein
MQSVRAMATCVGLIGNFSVVRDLFGFIRGKLPPDPTGVAVTVSLSRQARRLRGRHFHLNIIAIGRDQFSDADFIELDYSVFKLRNIYHTVSIGVGRVRHWGVSTADADGLDTPTSEGDLEDITNHWTVPNYAIDMFIPHNMSVASNGGTTLGLSPQDGPCDKNDDDMNGSTCGLWGSEQTARSFAHEIGHYLGVGHASDRPENLMCQSGGASNIRDSVQLLSSQGDQMRVHCFVRDGC